MHLLQPHCVYLLRESYSFHSANFQTPRQPAAQDQKRPMFCLPRAINDSFSGVSSVPAAFPGFLLSREHTTSFPQTWGSQGSWGLSSHKQAVRSMRCSIHQVMLTAASQPPGFLPPSLRSWVSGLHIHALFSDLP